MSSGPCYTSLVCSFDRFLFKLTKAEIMFQRLLRKVGRILLPFIIFRGSIGSCYGKEPLKNDFKKEIKVDGGEKKNPPEKKNTPKKLELKKSNYALKNLDFKKKAEKVESDKERKTFEDKIDKKKELLIAKNKELLEKKAFEEKIAKKKELLAKKAEEIKNRKILKEKEEKILFQKKKMQEFNDILQSLDKPEETKVKEVPMEFQKPVLPSWMKNKILTPLITEDNKLTPQFIMKAVTGTLALGIYTQLLDEAIKFFHQNPNSSMNDFVEEKASDSSFKNRLLAGISCSVLCLNSDTIVKLFLNFYQK